MASIDFNLLAERLADIGLGFPASRARVATFREQLATAWLGLEPEDHAFGLVALLDLVTEVTKEEYQITDYTLEVSSEEGNAGVDFQIKSQYWSIPLLVGNFYKALVEMGGENFVTIRLNLVDDDGIPRKFDVILQYAEKKSLSDVYLEVKTRNEELEEEVRELEKLLEERNTEINEFLDMQPEVTISKLRDRIDTLEDEITSLHDELAGPSL